MESRSRTSALLVVVALATWNTYVAAAPVKVPAFASTASNSAPGRPPQNISDGDEQTIWNAGAFATPKSPQWIQVDLGRTVAVAKIRLLVEQFPAGHTVHTISVGQAPDNLRVVRTFNGVTTVGQWLEHVGDGDAGDRMGDVRYVRITTTSSPSWVAWREIEIYQGIEYLGYFASAFEGHGVGEYTVETLAAGANLTWISAKGGDIGAQVSQLMAKFAVAKNVGIKAMVMVAPQLFDSNRNRLLSWEANWQAIKDAIVTNGYGDAVAGFYLIDEPYGDDPIRNLNVLSSLIEIATRVNADFPGKPLTVILAPSTVGIGASYIFMFDWVGFDCYGPWEKCDSSGESIRAKIDTLRANLNNSQRMIVVPEAFRWNGDIGLDKELVLIDRLNTWHHEILSDAKYVAVVPFLWPSMQLEESLPNGENHTPNEVGARELSWVKERIHQVSFGLLHSDDTRVYPIDFDASNSRGWQTPFAAIDRDERDSWNSGANAPQWIDFDFGGSTHLSRIEFLTAQTPAGPTVHRILGATTNNGPWTLLGVLSDNTHDNQLCTWTGPSDYRWVRVRTDVSPSWVSWREVRFFR